MRPSIETATFKNVRCSVRQWRRQRSKEARSFQGQKILQSRHQMHFFPQKSWRSLPKQSNTQGYAGRSQGLSQGGGSSSQVKWPGAPWCSAATGSRVKTSVPAAVLKEACCDDCAVVDESVVDVVFGNTEDTRQCSVTWGLNVSQFSVVRRLSSKCCSTGVGLESTDTRSDALSSHTFK